MFSYVTIRHQQSSLSLGPIGLSARHELAQHKDAMPVPMGVLDSVVSTGYATNSIRRRFNRLFLHRRPENLPLCALIGAAQKNVGRISIVTLRRCATKTVFKAFLDKEKATINYNLLTNGSSSLSLRKLYCNVEHSDTESDDLLFFAFPYKIVIREVSNGLYYLNRTIAAVTSYRFMIGWQACLEHSLQTSQPFPSSSARIGVTDCEFHRISAFTEDRRIQN